MCAAQQASPFSIFFSDEGSLRVDGSPGETGWDTESIECKTDRMIRVCWCRVCARSEDEVIYVHVDVSERFNRGAFRSDTGEVPNWRHARIARRGCVGQVL